MKKLIILVFVLLISSGAYADTWCLWSGTEGTQCLSDRDGVVRIVGKVPTRTESIINSYGYYRVVVTEPSVGADQTKDAVVWGITGNQITKTWTVRDLTQTEIDQRAASRVIEALHWIIHVLDAKNIIKKSDLEDENIPQYIIDAIEAWERLNQ